MRIVPVLLVVLLVGAVWAPMITGSNDSKSTSGGPTVVEDPVDAVGLSAAAGAGPIPMVGPADLSGLLGLPAGTLALDESHTALALAAAQFVAVQGDPVPVGAYLDPETAAFVDHLDDPELTIERPTIDFLLDRDPIDPQSLDLVVVNAVAAHVRLLELQRDVHDRLTARFGSLDAGIAALEESLQGNTAETAAVKQALAPHADDLVQAAADWSLAGSKGVATATAYPPAAPGYILPGMQAATRGIAGPETSLGSLAQSLQAAGLTPRGLGQALQVPAMDVVQAEDFLAAIQAYANAAAQPLSTAQKESLASYQEELEPHEERLLATIIATSAAIEERLQQAQGDLQPAQWDAVSAALEAATQKDASEEELAAATADALAMVNALDAGAMGEALGQALALVDLVTSLSTMQASQSYDPPALVEAPYLVVGSQRAEEFTEHTYIHIDFGGDDLYRHGVAGFPSTAIGGAQFLFGWDFEGDDVYFPDGGCCNGYGALGAATAGGLAVFVDSEGDDRYDARNYRRALGAGDLGGIGLFWDDDGRDEVSWTAYATSSSTIPQLAMGAANLGGVGMFVDRAGDDDYRATTNRYDSGAMGAHVTAGQALFIDGGGDDVYTIQGVPRSSDAYHSGGMGLGMGTNLNVAVTPATALAAAPLGLGSGESHFFDLRGDDEYRRTLAFGLGYVQPHAGAVSFFDGGGTDTYTIKDLDIPFLQGQYGDDEVWIHAPYTETAGSAPAVTAVGVDRVAGPQPPGADLVARIIEPRGGAKAAPDATVTMTLAAENRGNSDLDGVTGTVVFYEADPETQQVPIPTGERSTVDFGTVPAGSVVTVPLAWETPADEAFHVVELIIDPVPGELEASNNRDANFFSVEAVPELVLSSVGGFEVSRIAADQAITLNATLFNHGNVPISSSLTFQYCTLTGQGAGCDSAGWQDIADLPVAMQPTSRFWSASQEGVMSQMTHAWTGPTDDGHYRLRGTIPGSTNAFCNSGVAGCTLASIDFEVLDTSDAAVSPVVGPTTIDAAYFDTVKFTVRNLGTRSYSGDATFTVGTPHSTEEVDAFSITGLAPAEARTYSVSMPDASPKNGETWTFTALVESPDDDFTSNDEASIDIHFVKNVLHGDGFDQITPNVERPPGIDGINEWEHGILTGYGGLSPRHSSLPDAYAWGTDLNSFVDRSSTHDLVYRGVDITNYLDPVVRFHHSIDGYTSSTANYGIGNFWVAPAGTDAWTLVEPREEPYPCRNPSTADGQVGFCGLDMAWEAASFDLAPWEGQPVDLLFRYSSGTIYSGYAGWAVDDLRILGVPRLDDDLQVVAVEAASDVAAAGEPTTLHVTVRNNGYDAITGIPVTLRLTPGTQTTQAVDFQTEIASLEGAESVTVEFPWTPASAKMHFLQAEVLYETDSRPGNNVFEDELAVFEIVALEDLSSTDPSDWTVQGTPSPPEWELGVSSGWPGAPPNEPTVWGTDLDGPYIQGSSGQDQYHRLTTPLVQINDHEPGDKYRLAFNHAHSFTKYNYGDYYHDLGYVLLQQNHGSAELLTPIDGYPGSTYYYMPVSNPSGVGFEGQSGGWIRSDFPLGAVNAGDGLEFTFVLFSSRYASTSGDGEKPGWYIDDLAVLREPRFDRDLTVKGVTPVAYEIGESGEVGVSIENLGRLDYVNGAIARVDFFLDGVGKVASGSAPIPAIDRGATQTVPVPVQLPQGFAGKGRVEATIDWLADEWDRNNGASSRVDVGRVFMHADFEKGNDGFTNLGLYGPGFQRSADGPLQGTHSFATGRLAAAYDGGSMGGPEVDLTDPDGVRLRSVHWSGEASWSNTCPYNGIRFVDHAHNWLLQPEGLPLTYVATLGGNAHCGDLGRFPFQVDLTQRHASNDPELRIFQPRIDARVYYSTSLFDINNDGMKVDMQRIVGTPFDRDLGVAALVEPKETVAGPGELLRLTAKVTGNGLKPLSGVTAVQFTSNDQGPDGEPTLDQLAPLDPLAFGEHQEVSVDWTPPESLDGQRVTIKAEVVRVLPGGLVAPLVDDFAGNNAVQTVLDVVSIHDLAVSAQAFPSLVPDDVVPTAIQVTMENQGTRTEDGVDVTLRIRDAAGSLLHEELFAVARKAPDSGSSPLTFQTSWTPPGVGHYHVEADVAYPLEALDRDRDDNQAKHFVHMGVLPYRSGDDMDPLDEDGPVSTFTARGGKLSSTGWGLASGAEKPFQPVAGDWFLHSNPGTDRYEDNADYAIDLPLDLRAASGDLDLVFQHRYSLARGDSGTVQLSTDQGRTWDTLVPDGGYPHASGFRGDVPAWTPVTFDLDEYAGEYVGLRFQLRADATVPGTGWAIDEVKVMEDGQPLEIVSFTHPLGEVIAVFDFETGPQGWVKNGPPEYDDWEFGTPTSPDSPAPHSGSNLWGTVLDGSYTQPPGVCCPAPENKPRTLTSPVMNVPAGTEDVVLTWWEWAEVKESGYYYYPGDGWIVQISRDGGPYELVTPRMGYTHDDTRSPPGWADRVYMSGATNGWRYQIAELEDVAGHDIRVRFTFDTPSAYRPTLYFNGPDQGLYVDDVALFGSAPGTGIVRENALLAGLHADTALLGQTVTATADIVNEAAQGMPARITWTWTGPEGALIREGARDVTLPSGISSHVLDMGSHDQHEATRLDVSITRKVGGQPVGDDLPFDDTAHTAVVLYETIYQEDFDGGPACGAEQPCLGWTHSNSYSSTLGADEWEHGQIPANKHPGAARSGPFAFSTDLTGDQMYQYYSRMDLVSPAFDVPPAGGYLTFWHAQEAGSWSIYHDGATFEINGQVVEPDTGYDEPDCGVYADYKPCVTGVHGWRESRIDLDPFAGQTVEFLARLSSDYYTPNGAGLSIDDIQVFGAPFPPSKDLAIDVLPVIEVDPGRAAGFQVQVRNMGTGSTSTAGLEVVAVRNGVEEDRYVAPIPPLTSGGAHAVDISLLEPPVQGQEFHFRLLAGPGGSLDQDPGNDIASTRVVAAPVVRTVDPALFDAVTQKLGPEARGAFRAVTDPERFGVAGPVIAAGFTRDVDGDDNEFIIQDIQVPIDGRLRFEHRGHLPSASAGAGVDIQDSDGSWQVLDPAGGYTHGAAAQCGQVYVAIGHRCFRDTWDWTEAVFPMDAFAGQSVSLRFRYETTTAIPADGGWALRDIRVTGSPVANNLVELPRWQVGGITNLDGPIEEASQPHAWGTGLASSSLRKNGYDILEGEPFRLDVIPKARLSFDYVAAPESGSMLMVQMRDAVGQWITVDSLSGSTQDWQRHEVDVPDLGEWSQVRFIYRTDGEFASKEAPAPGFFLDNILVGSLRADLTRIGDLEEQFTATDGGSFQVPVRVENTGAFSNHYTLDIRGPNPYWTAVSSPSAFIEPGESADMEVEVFVPFGGESGFQPFQVLAKSLFDPLQAGVLGLEVNVTVSPKPDFEVTNIQFQSSFQDEPGQTPRIIDARPNTLIATVVNNGLKSPTEPVRVQFLEHFSSGEVRPLDATVVPANNLTHPGTPLHSPYDAFVDWFPRKDVVAVEVVVNPDAVGNPAPQVPEMDDKNNAVIQAVDVQARALPELILDSAVDASRAPQVGEPLELGIDVRNVGSLATSQPVDVAVLAGYQGAMLTSPVFNLPSNSVVKLHYDMDLEKGADAMVLEIREAGGGWERLVPVAGYTHGCILSLDCVSGLSGEVEGAITAFDLAGYEGPVELRVVFAMDSHNGRVYDGVRLHEVAIEQFLQPVRRFQFTDTSSAWESSHTWNYVPREGPFDGRWEIPRNYVNPYVVNLRQIGSLATGALDHVSVPWTPQAPGEQQLLIYLDPKNLEPEFADDLNRYMQSVHVRLSDFGVDVSGGCICLEGGDDTVATTLRMTNLGNAASTFQVNLRDARDLATQLTVQGKPLKSLVLGPGSSQDVALQVVGQGATAGAASLFVDVVDTSTGKSFEFRLPVSVDVRSVLPEMTGEADMEVTRVATEQFTIANPSNAEVPVLLRISGKPTGLAVKVEPSDFVLSPFESRSVEVTLQNLGVAAGTYSFDVDNALHACDGEACARLATLTVGVTDYRPPVAAIGLPDSEILPGVPASFTDASKVTGSTVTSWSWAFGDGGTSTEPDPSHAYTAPGTYSVRLTVTDSEGATVTSPAAIVVVRNAAPVVVAHVETPPDGVPVGAPVNFTADGSTDLDGGIAKVTWAFGDGNQGSGLNVTHTYQRPGAYRVTVAVEDVYKATTVQVLEVVVTDASSATEGSDGSGETAGADDGALDVPSPGIVFVAAVVMLALVLRRRNLS